MSRKTDKYGDKSYINAEALLSFDGTDDSVTLGNLSYLNGVDFSIEIIASWDLNAGVRLISNRDTFSEGVVLIDGEFRVRDQFGEQAIATASVASGKLYHLVYTYNHTTKTAQAYKNGVLIESDTNLSVNTVSVSTDFVISVSGADFDGSLGLLRFYDKVLSSQEVTRVHREPYAIPSTLDVNVVGEYIPPRSYYKDTGNIYGKGTNAILWFDSAEQYNYAKGLPITANHGVLTGWSDVEVVDKPLPTSVLGFYIENTDADLQTLLIQSSIDNYTAPNGDRLNSLDIFIKDLKDSGLWETADVIIETHYNNTSLEEFAKYNIKNPSHRISGAISYNGNGFIRGSGVQPYITFNWNPSIDGINYQLDSACIEVYQITNSEGNQMPFGILESSNFINSLWNRNAGRFTGLNTNNSATGIQGFPISNFTNTGSNLLTYDGTNCRIFGSGVIFDSKAITSTAIPNAELFGLTRNDVGSVFGLSSDRVSGYYIGADISGKAGDLNTIREAHRARINSI